MSLSAARPVLHFDVVPMCKSDLAAAQGLSHAVGWPHREEDWDFGLSIGEGLSAYSDGKLVGTAMLWRYERKQARLGMMIVDPGLQRCGVGRALMQGLLERTAEPSVLLNATEAGATLYHQLGFKSFGSIVQHQGTAFSAPLVPLRAGERIRPMGRSDTGPLIELDALAVGARRTALIAALMDRGDGVVLDDGGVTVGFAFCRRFGLGHVIGPVVARDTAAAKALIANWIGSNAGMFMRIDVPGQSGLSDWLEELGLMSVGPVVTMIRGAALPTQQDYHVFAVANQALG